MTEGESNSEIRKFSSGEIQELADKWIAIPLSLQQSMERVLSSIRNAVIPTKLGRYAWSEAPEEIMELNSQLCLFRLAVMAVQKRGFTPPIDTKLIETITRDVLDQIEMPDWIKCCPEYAVILDELNVMQANVNSWVFDQSRLKGPKAASTRDTANQQSLGVGNAVPEAMIPSWNPIAFVLTYGGNGVEFSRNAKSVDRLFMELQVAGWPHEMPTKVVDATTYREAVRSAVKKSKTIGIVFAFRNSIVSWSITPRTPGTPAGLPDAF